MKGQVAPGNASTGDEQFRMWKGFSRWLGVRKRNWTPMWEFWDVYRRHISKWSPYGEKRDRIVFIKAREDSSHIAIRRARLEFEVSLQTKSPVQSAMIESWWDGRMVAVLIRTSLRSWWSGTLRHQRKPWRRCSLRACVVQGREFVGGAQGDAFGWFEA